MGLPLEGGSRENGPNSGAQARVRAQAQGSERFQGGTGQIRPSKSWIRIGDPSARRWVVSPGERDLFARRKVVSPGDSAAGEEQSNKALEWHVNLRNGGIF